MSFGDSATGGEPIWPLPNRLLSGPQGFDITALQTEFGLRLTQFHNYVNREIAGYKLHRRIGAAVVAQCGVAPRLGPSPFANGFFLQYPVLDYDPEPDEADARLKVVLGEFRHIDERGVQTVTPYVDMYSYEDDEGVASYKRSDLALIEQALQGGLSRGLRGLYETFLHAPLDNLERLNRIDEQATYLGWLSEVADYLEVPRFIVPAALPLSPNTPQN